MPVEVDIPAFIELILARDYAAAARKIKETNALPASAAASAPGGAVEAVCVVGKKNRPVAIGYLERFVSDYERDTTSSSYRRLPADRPPVAVVAPDGWLTVAGDLIKLGHKVTISSPPQTAGCWFTHPGVRLPS